MILGRLASVVAKRLLNGERILVVNVEKSVISGKRRSVISEAKIMLDVRSLRNPNRGPKLDRFPDRIFRNVVWGMLPKDKASGRRALKRLSVFIGFPDECRGYPVTRIEEADAGRLSSSYVFLGDLAKELGWKGGVVVG